MSQSQNLAHFQCLHPAKHCHGFSKYSAPHSKYAHLGDSVLIHAMSSRVRWGIASCIVYLKVTSEAHQHVEACLWWPWPSQKSTFC